MAFKRMKGLLDLGELPMKDPRLAYSYLAAKLLAALMLEDLTKDFLAFSPAGFEGRKKAGVPLENPANVAGGDDFRHQGTAQPLGAHLESGRADSPLL